MASEHHLWSLVDANHAPMLGIVARRTYAIASKRLVASAATEWQPTSIDVFALLRETTDVILSGSAHSARGPVQRLSTGVSVGPMHKRVDAIGNRQLRVGTDGALSQTSPEPFTSMPLTWERAYGGRDEGAEAVLSFEGIERYGMLAYPRNPHGCGYHIDVDRRRLDGIALPNLSDPDDPVTPASLLAAEYGDWIDRPLPATYLPMDEPTFPRLVHFRLGIVWSRHERPVREIQLGALVEADLAMGDFGGKPDPRAYNAAAPGLATARLRGDEKVSLWNLHREHEHLELSLPGDVPRMLIEPPNTKTFELEPKLATVHIEPDEDRITLTWAGSMAVGGIYAPEICAQMRRAVTWN